MLDELDSLLQRIQLHQRTDVLLRSVQHQIDSHFFIIAFILFLLQTVHNAVEVHLNFGHCLAVSELPKILPLQQLFKPACLVYSLQLCL